MDAGGDGNLPRRRHAAARWADSGSQVITRVPYEGVDEVASTDSRVVGRSPHRAGPGQVVSRRDLRRPAPQLRRPTSAALRVDMSAGHANVSPGGPDAGH